VICTATTVELLRRRQRSAHPSASPSHRSRRREQLRLSERRGHAECLLQRPRESRMSHFTATCGCALAEVAASAALSMIEPRPTVARRNRVTALDLDHG